MHKRNSYVITLYSLQTDTVKESKADPVKESKEVTNVKKETVETPTVETKPSRKPSTKADVADKKLPEKKKNQTPDAKKSSGGGSTNPESSKSPSKSPTIVIPLTKVDQSPGKSLSNNTDERTATNATKAGSNKVPEMKKDTISSPDGNSSTSARPRRSITRKNNADENSTK